VLTCGILDESGRDSWACRLTGRSHNPVTQLKTLPPVLVNLGGRSPGTIRVARAEPGKSRRFRRPFAFLCPKRAVSGNFMLRCKMPNAAMQTSLLFLASGIHITCSRNETAILTVSRKGIPMSKTASVALHPTSSLCSRLLAAIDRLLMASAEISNRNGDLPRFGL